MAFKNSYNRVERAEEILDEIILKIDIDSPFSHVLETNVLTHKRTTLIRRNQKNLDKLVIRCGELLHNLRSAIDLAYFEAVSQYVEMSKHKAIQFPISKNSDSYEHTIKSRLGDKAGDKFFNALKTLNAFDGEGGNFKLVLLHEINVGDKHKAPIITGDMSKIDSSYIRQLIPDFPRGISNVYIGGFGKNVTWESRLYNPRDVGSIVPPFMHVYQKIIAVPIEIWFHIISPKYEGEIITTLQMLIAETKATLDIMLKGIKQ